MKFEYNLILKHTNNIDLHFLTIETNESLLENIADIIIQQQKAGNIPYGYNLISISVKVL